jgi:hypothetical protein
VLGREDEALHQVRADEELQVRHRGAPLRLLAQRDLLEQDVHLAQQVGFRIIAQLRIGQPAEAEQWPDHERQQEQQQFGAQRHGSIRSRSWQRRKRPAS